MGSFLKAVSRSVGRSSVQRPNRKSLRLPQKGGRPEWLGLIGLTLNPGQSGLTLPLPGKVSTISAQINIKSFTFQSKSIRVKLDVETKIAAHASADPARSAFDTLRSDVDQC